MKNKLLVSVQIEFDKEEYEKLADAIERLRKILQAEGLNIKEITTIPSGEKQ